MTAGWRDQFTRPPVAAATLPATAMPVEIDDELAAPIDTNVYQPWILQRGRGRPVMFIDFRRIEPRAGTVIGRQMGYPYLQAIDYIGDQIVSLDFGMRQYVIEGKGLSALARFLQQGHVLAVQEFSERTWRSHDGKAVVTKIVEVVRP